MKQFGLARFFEPAPESVMRFAEVLQIANDLGYQLMTPRRAVETYEAIPGVGFESIENGCAWHGGTAKAWMNTPQARLLDPVCRSLHQGAAAIAAHLEIDEMRRESAFRAVLRQITSAYVSDARWPPAPTSPGRFNVEEALASLTQANDGLAAIVTARGLDRHHGLYSPDIMQTQIVAIREELMALPYFEEKQA